MSLGGPHERLRVTVLQEIRRPADKRSRSRNRWCGNGVSAFLTSPASTQASTYEVAQINPDQMTRNAPRDLPSFEQNYQMHTGVLDSLRH